MIIVVFILIIICCCWIYLTADSKRINKATASLPMPPALPIIGNAMLFMGNSERIWQNLQDIATLAYKNSGAVKLWLGPKLYIAIGNPQDAQVVLENCLDKDVVYRFLRPWLGHGLFIAPLGLWKTHRKVLLPVFHNKVVEEYLGVISKQADVLIERLNEKSGKEEFDVLSYISACTLDIVFETAMGEKMDVQHTPDTPYLQARHTVMTILNKRLFKVWLQPDCLFNLTSYAKQQKDNIDLTHKFTDEVVLKRRQHYEAKKYKNNEDTQSGYLGYPTSETYQFRDENSTPYMVKPGPIQGITMCSREIVTDGNFKTVLDLLFGREIEFTNEELREHIDSITIAGNDTTALVIAYTLLLLGIHQDAQERVYEEQKYIFGHSKSGATKDDLQKMNYLEKVIKESMRLYTVIPIIARNVDKEIYLPNCKVTIPQGAGAVIGSFAIHRSKILWGPDADEFDPDRFLPERSVYRHPAAFIPFSHGSRNCIGRNFGMLIIKSVISSIIRTYKVEANEVGPLKVEMLLFPIRGHQIKVLRRDI